MLEVFSLVTIFLSLFKQINGWVLFAAVLIVFYGGGDGKENFIWLAAKTNRFIAVQHDNFVGLQSLIIPGGSTRW